LQKKSNATSGANARSFLTSCNVSRGDGRAGTEMTSENRGSPSSKGASGASVT
jgi:hypothetical protein